jgi:exopolysaccharide biosynthesis glucuronosyltransferase PssE
MIFVTVGTSSYGFDRLLRGVDELDVGDELVVQYGASSFVPRVTEKFMPYAEVVENMSRARAVIAHGGVGSILTALHVGRHPIVVPRHRCYSEAVDDHQVDLAERLAHADLVTLVHDTAKLSQALAVARAANAPAERSSSLALSVSDYVESILGPIARSSPE